MTEAADSLEQLQADPTNAKILRNYTYNAMKDERDVLQAQIEMLEQFVVDVSCDQNVPNYLYSRAKCILNPLNSPILISAN